MGGVDKGLQDFHGVPLALHVLRRLQAGKGVAQFMINANRNENQYRALGLPVWPDSVPDYAGPLAGFLAGMTHCETPYLLTAPCDAPLLPLDLAQRLGAALLAEQADIAMACAPQADETGLMRLRPQPVFCLLKCTLVASLGDFVAQGGHKVRAWTGQHRTALVNFDRLSDDPAAFFNANTLADLQQLARTAS